MNKRILFLRIFFLAPVFFIIIGLLVLFIEDNNFSLSLADRYSNEYKKKKAKSINCRESFKKSYYFGYLGERTWANNRPYRKYDINRRYYISENGDVYNVLRVVTSLYDEDPAYCKYWYWGKLNKVVNIRKNKNSSGGISSVFKREIRIENKDLITYETTTYFKSGSRNKTPIKRYKLGEYFLFNNKEMIFHESRRWRSSPCSGGLERKACRFLSFWK